MSAKHRLKITGSEMVDKYPGLSRKLEMLWKIKVTAIQIVVSALEMVAKILEKRLGELEAKGRIKTIQITTVSL